VAGDNLARPRNPKSEVYDLIIDDCKKAIEMLPVKASYGASDLGRACREAAMVQLAKVYLTLGTNYQEVVSLCENIEGLGYDLSEMDYAANFNKNIDNGPESLFEVQYSGSTVYDFWGNDNQACWLSTYMCPRNSGWVGGSWGWQHVTQEFVDAYEEGDLRKMLPFYIRDVLRSTIRNTTPHGLLQVYNVRKFRFLKVFQR
jgi:hypothetical protein